MTTTSTAPGAVADTGQALYVYGIVPAAAPVALDESLGMGGGVRLVAAGPVAAVVEPIDPDRPLGRRRDLLTHSEVLNALALEGPVLPMRFGSVVQGEQAVTAELLAPQRERFQDLLEQVTGKVQLTLRARYELDTVLAEIVAAEPEVAELRRRTADLPEESTHFERVRLGELVAHAVDVRRERDADVVTQTLAPHCLEVLVRDAPGMDGLTELSLLVSTDRVGELEGVAEALAEEMAGRARLSLVGPMALYDFITGAVTWVCSPDC